MLVVFLADHPAHRRRRAWSWRWGAISSPNQTLQTFGLANAAAGAIGGIHLGDEHLRHDHGAAIRRCLPAGRRDVGPGRLGFWLAGPELLAWVPAFVVGGLIVFVGLEFVGEWVILQWQRLNGADRAILVAVVAGRQPRRLRRGLRAGPAPGLRVLRRQLQPPAGDPPRDHGPLPLQPRRAPRGRARPAARARRRHPRPGARRLPVLRLGLAGLCPRPAARAGPAARRRCVPSLLDFSRVSGVDSSGWHNFRKIVELAEQHAFHVVLTQLPAAVARLLQLEAVAGPQLPHVRVTARSRPRPGMAGRRRRWPGRARARPRRGDSTVSARPARRLPARTPAGLSPSAAASPRARP